jgi:sugar lactone lactonase YvrE
LTSNTANNGGISANSLDGPIGVTLDAQGNVYVADHYNNRVLEYDTPFSAGTTADRVFGQPTMITNTVNNGGLGAASLSGPMDVALDARGSLYVADSGNNRVLEYNSPLSSATADRVFGQASFGQGAANNGGAVSAAGLNNPIGVALDAQDNLYVADEKNNRVLEYDVPVPYGVPVLSALGPSSVAAGSPAFTLAVNGSGFVAGSVVQWNGSKHITTFINSTQLTISVSLADLAGGGTFLVSVFTPPPGGGGSLTTAGLYHYGRAGHDATADVVQGQPNFSANAENNLLLPGANRLKFPNGVAVDLHSGRLFVADTYNNRVLSWPNAPAFANAQPPDLVLGQPNFLAHTGNNGGVSARSLFYPYEVALDAQGNLYVADYNNSRVLEYDAPLSSGMAASRVFGQGGNFTTALPNNGGVSANSLSGPTALALDSHGNLYVADGGNNRVLEYDTPLSTDTTADRVFGQPDFNQRKFNNGGLGSASLDNPDGVALDAHGNLYVADLANQRVLEYDVPLSSGMAASRVFGQPDFGHSDSNQGGLGAKSLFEPGGLALDGWGNLYVADYGNHRVLEYYTPLVTGMAASRVFGQPDFGHNDGNHGGLSANSLSFPAGVALDAQANLYVADQGNSRVLEYDWALFSLRLPLALR